MSNGDSSAVPSQYGDDEIWFFEVRCPINRQKWYIDAHALTEAFAKNLLH